MDSEFRLCLLVARLCLLAHPLTFVHDGYCVSQHLFVASHVLLDPCDACALLLPRPNEQPPGDDHKTTVVGQVDPTVWKFVFCYVLRASRPNGRPLERLKVTLPARKRCGGDVVDVLGGERCGDGRAGRRRGRGKRRGGGRRGVEPC